ncbi:hypothetical protein AN958_10241, partial [Leucoagaricus sp. SymC.cos]
LTHSLDEIVRLVSNEAELEERIKQLEVDLQVYKRIFSDTNAEKKRLEEENELLKQNSEKQKESLEKHTSVRFLRLIALFTVLNFIQAARVIVLLDGDGAIFTPQLIALGQNGGHKAASRLSESIKDHIRSLDENHQFQLSVYIFFNKRGLTDTFNRCNYHSARIRLEDFVTGFNQASEKFIMVDVGNGKEAADSKIKAFLEDEIRLPQTYKVLFGGCHDNGYVTTIRSHITSGFKHKLILLQSYAEHAAGFDSLELPDLAIPGLFISQKLVSTPSQDPLVASRALSPPLFDAPIQDTAPSVSGPFDTTQNNESGIQLPASFQSYKEKPPPCTVHYLTNSCPHGPRCRYGHDYVLEPEHYAEIKVNVKKSPCPAVNKNQNCKWGDACYYGHTCPFGAKCSYFKKGRCRFIGGLLAPA